MKIDRLYSLENTESSKNTKKQLKKTNLWVNKKFKKVRSGFEKSISGKYFFEVFMKQNT